MTNLHIERRKARLNTITTMINKAKAEGRVINREKLIAIICLNFICTKRKAQEYLSVLEDSGVVSLSVESGQKETTKERKETLQS